MQTDSQIRYLVFTLGNENFAIPLLSVQEVLAPTKLTPMPNVPAYHLGIMNLRGQVLAVFDLGKKLGIKTKQSSESAVLVCQTAEGSLGFLVDSVNTVHTAKDSDIVPASTFQGSIPAAVDVTGIIRQEKTLTMVLSVDKIIGQNLSSRAA